MANEGSWAVTLPDKSAQVNNQLMNTLYMRNIQQQRLQSLQQQREFMRQQKLTSLLGENFKDSNYATGTAADPIINQMTADARQHFAQIIHDNPNMDEGELEMKMQQELGNVSKYSAAIKAGAKGIDAMSQHYQTQPGIDLGALKQGALNNMIFTTDAQGNRTLRPVDQIDASKNYMGEELNQHPELYVQGDQPLEKAIEAYKPKKGGDTVINENRGITTENKYTDQLYPWQSLKKDAKGNVIGIQTNSQPATLSDGTVLKDPKTGQPLQVLSDEDYNRLQTNGTQAQMRRDVNQYIHENGMKPEDFPTGSEGYNILAKHVMLGKVDALTPSEFTPEMKKTDNSLVTKMQLGTVDALGRILSKADERREQELLNGQYGRIRQAANFTPDALAAGVPWQGPDGKQYMDVTDFTGGMKTAADKKAASQYDTGYKQVQRILIDPSNPGKIYTVEGSDGHIQEYSPQDIDALLMRHSEANGYKNLDDVKKIIGKIPIVPNQAAARNLRAEMEFRNRQVQNLNASTPFGFK